MAEAGTCLPGKAGIYDAVIIGAGVTGCAIARELSRWQVKACVLERAEDVCCGTSKANSAIIHAGFDAEPGSWKARMNVRGSAMMPGLCRELDVPFRRNGTIVLCTAQDGRTQPEPEALQALQKLLEKGRQNGVPGLEILPRETLLAMEPNLTQQTAAGLYAPTGGIICPFTLTIALAENACRNGVEFRLNTEVLHITRCTGGYRIHTTRGILESRAVINAAGVYADTLHNMVSTEKLHITPRKGEYCLFDHTAGEIVSHTIFQLPTEMGKGVLVTPTIHGNLLIGPTAVDITDREAVNTTQAGLDTVFSRAAQSIREIPVRQVITAFAGLRAHEDGDDFVLGEVRDAPGFFDAAGIESPGLSSAPAIGELISRQVAAYLQLSENPDFSGSRAGIPQVHALPFAERTALIAELPDYADIICRCEMISRGEILDAIRREPGARSLDGVKRRTRAGMGRCQSGFCAPRVLEILRQELQLPVTEITKCGGASRLIVDAGKSVPVQAGTRQAAEERAAET